MHLGATAATAMQPRWWPGHLALVVVLAGFGWLGWWQLGTFEDAAAPAARPAAAPVPVDRLTEPGGRLDPADVGRTVRATGRWEAAGQLVVPGRDRAGRTGAWVVTPLRTDAGVLPVVRGWLPSPGTAAAPPQGSVTVTAVLQRSETEADSTAATGTTGPGEVGYVATVTLLSALPYDADDLYDGFAVLRSQRPPVPAAPALVAPAERSVGEGVGRWRNLAYGLQWWVFAAAAAVFWVLVLRRASGEARAARDAPPRTT